jgi:hypothetical protein
MARNTLSALLIGAAILTTFAGCGQRFSFFGPSTSGSYFTTKLCGVDLTSKTRNVHLRIELAVERALPRGSFVEVEFENPADRAAPLVVGRSVAGSERTLLFVSPAATGVRPRGYEIVARVYATPEKKQVLGQHTQVCQSLIDQRELPAQFR